MIPSKGERVDLNLTFEVTVVDHDVEPEEPFRERRADHPETGEPEPYLRVRLQLRDDCWDAFQQDGVIGAPPKMEFMAQRSVFEDMTAEEFVEVARSRLRPEVIEAFGVGLRAIHEQEGE